MNNELAKKILQKAWEQSDETLYHDGDIEIKKISFRSDVLAQFLTQSDTKLEVDCKCKKILEEVKTEANTEIVVPIAAIVETVEQKPATSAIVETEVADETEEVESVTYTDALFKTDTDAALLKEYIIEVFGYEIFKVKALEEKLNTQGLKFQNRIYENLKKFKTDKRGIYQVVDETSVNSEQPEQETLTTSPSPQIQTQFIPPVITPQNADSIPITEQLTGIPRVASEPAIIEPSVISTPPVLEAQIPAIGQLTPEQEENIFDIDTLVGKKVAEIRLQTESEYVTEGWEKPTTLIEFEDGTKLYPASFVGESETESGEMSVVGTDLAGLIGLKIVAVKPMKEQLKNAYYDTFTSLPNIIVFEKNKAVVPCTANATELSPVNSALFLGCNYSGEYFNF